MDALQHGAQQPFYQVLVDVRDWPPQGPKDFVAYAAQEEVQAPQVSCAKNQCGWCRMSLPWLRTMVCVVPTQPPSTWKSENGDDGFQHPYTSFLFLGDDENGDLIPTRALRDKYKQPRIDVQPPEG